MILFSVQWFCCNHNLIRVARISLWATHWLCVTTHFKPVCRQFELTKYALSCYLAKLYVLVNSIVLMLVVATHGKSALSLFNDHKEPNFAASCLLSLPWFCSPQFRSFNDPVSCHFSLCSHLFVWSNLLLGFSSWFYCQHFQKWITYSNSCVMKSIYLATLNRIKGIFFLKSHF